MPFFSAEAAESLRPEFYPRYRNQGVGISFDLKKLFAPKRTTIPKPAPPEIDPSKKRIYDSMQVEPGDVKIVQQLPEMMIIKRYDGYYYLQNHNDSGWMEWGDWYIWREKFINKEYQDAERNKQAFRRKADLLLTGTDKDTVEQEAKAAYTQQWDVQKKIARSKGVSALSQKTEAFLKQHGGKLLMAVGTVAVVIPVVGWIAGPVLAIAGKVLDSAQTAQYAAKIAKKKQAELLALRKRYENGEISDEEYKKLSQGEYADALKEIVAEEQAAAEAQQQEPQQYQQSQKKFATSKRIDVKKEATKEQFPTGSVAIGGGIAAAGLALALVIALVATRR